MRRGKHEYNRWEENPAAAEVVRTVYAAGMPKEEVLQLLRATGMRPSWAGVTLWANKHGIARKAKAEYFRAIAAGAGLKVDDLAARIAAAPKPEPAPAIDPIEEERDRQDRLRKLRDEREALKAIAGEQSLRAFAEKLFRDIVPAVAPAPPYKSPPRVKGKRPTRETLLLHLSDWHYGEIVKDEATRGFNSYDVEIAENRVRSVVSSVVSIAEKLREGGGWEFPRLVVALNGDLITGTIHELERHSEPRNIIWSVYHCGLLLAEQLRNLSAAFPRVNVFCTSGNHGRLMDAHRMQSKDPTRNWDTMVALIAKTALEREKRITIEIPDAYAVSYDVEGLTVLQAHGHDIKSWSGIPWYGINRFLGNYNGLEASRGGRISTYLFAHFHSHTNITYPGGEAFVNGCFPAGTPVGVPGGARPIEALAVGDEVFQRDGSTGRVLATKARVAAEGLVEIGIKGMYEPLRATPNHLVWAIKGETAKCVCRTHCSHPASGSHDEPRWLPMDALSPGDWVQMPTIQATGTRSIGEELAWAYGLFVAEGHTLVRAGKSKRHHRVVFTMHQAERHVLERAAAALAPILGTRGVISERPSRTTSQLCYSVPVEVAQHWRDEFGHTAINKRLPLWVYDLPVNERLAIVQGWIDGDGHEKRRADGHTTVTGTTVSRQLAWTLHQLATSGVRTPTLKRMLPGNSRVHDAYSILFNVGQDAITVKGERFVRVCHRRRLREPVTVYDVETTGHTFIANGIGVHNSLIGGTEWTINTLGRADRPSQTLLAIHPEHGVTHRWPIYADPLTAIEKRRAA